MEFGPLPDRLPGLVIGAWLALWLGRMLAHQRGVDRHRIIIALGLGIMLAVTSGKPTITRD